MRKHILSKLTGPAEPAPTLPDAPAGRQDYVDRGASRSMRIAIEDIAETSRRMTSGEVVVDVDPAAIDPSPIRDRLESAGETPDDVALRESIARFGQRVPILIRPKAGEKGRYVTVYGHRRAAAARRLGQPVRAVIAQMADDDAFVAQGQENNDRSNTSFIEKALFAARLRAKGLDRARVGAALGVDETLVSKMTTIAERVPFELIGAVGPAPGVGRPKWELLAALIEAHPKRWRPACDTADFAARSSDERFAIVLAALQTLPAAVGFAPVIDRTGASFAFVKRGARDVTIRIPVAERAGTPGEPSFADWLEARLAQLRDEWRSR